MAASDLPAMKTNPKFIFFTDFDGTITLQDSNDTLTDNLGFGIERRRALNKAVLDGTTTFRDAFHEMLESVKTPFHECIDYLLTHIALDPGFHTFLTYALAHHIPVVVLSSGMVPIIQALLHKLVGPADASRIQLVANQVRPKPGHATVDEPDGWEIVYHDESGFGHDKSRTIRPYAQLPAPERPTLFYAGDGVSDLSAARETDLLFAKEGRDLIDYCVREDIPFTVFRDWNDILEKTKAIVEGKITVHDAAKQGYEAYKAQQAQSKETVK